MTRATSVVDRLAEIDLRILVELYDADLMPIDLRFDDVSEFPLSAVDRSEVRARLLKLKEGLWITGELAGDVVVGAALDADTRKRLDGTIPGTNATRIQRARETLSNCNLGARQDDQARQVRNDVLDRPLGITRTWERP